MNKRIHLGSSACPNGVVWFTLVFESSDLFVEEYIDSNVKIEEKRLTRIPCNEFSRHQINGVPLRQIVDEKFKEIPYESQG